ncbi:MAG: hypothetical protein COX81_01110 [Candidatus Magasanikbacteria bacterium CG_4_10_14_0_2_um_filter_37_12]|uniref:TIGR00730 family Rossman fold protein n=1 Tax=Candidatus Magasanikbacteria bacterium CG_4_10_14_0_2_um_filter_37_12 TaxID=1974637 RepID=A0A2M7V8X3_9BACT|nr:MAG: hypothetical protein COX81_01110 [Candidatus Magasanikbacteria bacterium CG_4_10_14_0_2_um_filter_37_12]
MRKETIKKLKDHSKKDFSYSLNETGDYRDTWRIFRIMAEFVEGYEFMNSLENEVTVFGSARFKEGEIYYDLARELGSLLAKNEFTTVTGGGPGIMEAANRGSFEAGGESAGLNIQLPFEQRINPYVQKSIAFYYFFTRKVMMTSPAHAFVYFPGGFGTLDEFFEVVNSIELGKMCDIPIILVGREYWEPIVEFLKSKCSTFDQKKKVQIDKWYIVNTPEETINIINKQGTKSLECDLSPMNFHSGQKNIDWKIFRIMAELVSGFEFLTGLVEDVTVLGTRHMDQNNKFYKSAYKIGAMLAEDKYSVVTGGGIGISEAANKGAMEAGGQSLGVGLEVYGSSSMNSYVMKSIMFQFPFTRKLIITAPSKAFIFYPGGFGTLHHLFEVLTLIQTGKMQRVPVILLGREYWQPIHEVIKTIFVHKLETISDEDDELYQIVDSEESTMQIINEFRSK